MRTVRSVFKGKEDMNPQQFYSVVSSLEAVDPLLLELIVSMQEFRSTWDITIIAVAVMVASKLTLNEALGIVDDCIRNNIKLIDDNHVRSRLKKTAPLEKESHEKLFRI